MTRPEVHKSSERLQKLGRLEKLEKINKELIKNIQLLNKRKRHLLYIANSLPHFISIRDKDGKFLFVNDYFANAYNSTSEKLTGEKYIHIHNRDQINLYLSNDLEVINSGKPKFIPEELFIDIEGNEHVLQTIRIPFTLINQKELAVLSISIDVTEETITTEALLESNQRIELIKQHSGIGIWEWDINNNKIHRSKELYEILQSSEEELGMDLANYFKIVHPKDLEYLKIKLDHAIRMKSSFDIKYRLQKPNIYIEETILVLEETDNTGLVLLGITRDISKEYELEQQSKLFKHIFHIIDEQLALLSPNESVVFVNKPLQDFFGINEKSLQGFNFFNFLTHYLGNKEQFQQLRANLNKKKSIEVAIKNHSDKTFQCMLSIKNIEISDLGEFLLINIKIKDN